MKRLNPATGLPFKHGDIREDGYIFQAYKIGKPKTNGFFSENWLSPEYFEQHKHSSYKGKAARVKTPEGRAAHLFQSAKSRAKKNNQPINITAKWLEQKLMTGVCELTGIPFDYEKPNKTQYNPLSPSVDRIKSTKGYTKSNTRVVLTAVNITLNQYGEKIMLPILEALVKGIKKNAKKI